MWAFSPRRMIEPLPNCFSIWPSAISRALSRSTGTPPGLSVISCLGEVARGSVPTGCDTDDRRGIPRLSSVSHPVGTLPLATSPRHEMTDNPGGVPVERDKALEMALGQIEKQFGKGSIMRLGENAHMQIEVVPTGALALDVALGVGGLPRGRIVEIYGPESSGKTTLAQHVAAEVQKK